MLKEIFDNLDSWRHLPNYQLERRIDIIFSLYLRQVVQEFHSTYFNRKLELKEVIIPEFPIKRDLIYEDYKTNKSVKVDYVLFSKDINEVFFLELKTDKHSRRNAQDFYLNKAKDVGFKRILEGLKQIFIATRSKKKYCFLFKLLNEVEVLNLPDNLTESILNGLSGTNSMINDIKINNSDFKITIIYIQPEKINEDEDNLIIDFDFIARALNKNPDSISDIFSESLKEWKLNPEEDIEDYL